LAGTGIGSVHFGTTVEYNRGVIARKEYKQEKNVGHLGLGS